MRKVVVGIAGMSGAGKATFNEIAKRRGYAMVAMGDVIREETKRRGLKPTPENVGRIML
ncbi:AAA family ATPase, partial [Candidatus Bathyarchaeota archaeon]|nr:AAA family ATPase [Candidatus Bathyarchaeota archaeon]